VKFLYTLFLYLFLPAILLRLLVRGFRNPAYWDRWGERFGLGLVDMRADVWIHAVSVGEARAAAPLIHALLERGGADVLVTTMTPTGSDEVRRLFDGAVKHCYAPYDYPGSVDRFLDVVQPRTTIIMETEIWPNIISRCSSRGIPVLFANLRLSERSFRKYIKVSGFIGSILKKVSRFAVQSDRDARHLQALGADPDAIEVTGSIKFEIRIPASLNEVAQVLRREWGQERRVWIAGSTHEEEDDMVLDAYRKLKQKYTDLILVIVPRHPERFAAVTRLARKSEFNVVCRSESKRDISTTDIYIGDTMGELTLLYAASDVAMVGGSMIRHGGHNVLEPCALGIPVVFGPHMFNFLDISRLVLERNAGTQVGDEPELLGAVDDYFGDPNRRFKTGEAGRELIEENKGALSKTMSLFEAYVTA
jgi:3-deoxy-D-manno-octulosonic-acid transferase